MRFVRITPANRAQYQSAIAGLEKLAAYPLGQNETFQIDHGEDYFAFFDRLGRLEYRAAVDEKSGQVLAVGAGVLRSRPMRCWYLCDLKVHPDHRGRRIPLKMLRGAFILNYLKCPRGYGISMNPKDGRLNRVLQLMKHWKWSPFSLGATLLIYSVDAARMRELEPILRAHRGELGYLSLSGVKDLVLGSTGSKLPLIHVQFGPCADRAKSKPTPQDGNVHMFCAVEGDALATELEAHGTRPTATASIIHHGMKKSDWRFVLTSDI